MSRIKRVVMSNLPLEQNPTPINQLFERVESDMLVFGEKINNVDFEKALFSLRDEQALVFFVNRKETPVIATQYGFRIYGTG